MGITMAVRVPIGLSLGKPGPEFGSRYNLQDLE